MRLVALNENIAAYTLDGPDAEPDVRAALNKLMTVRSWKSLIEWLKNDGCNSLFAKREQPTLDSQMELWGKYEEELLGNGEYFFDELTGSLRARIDQDAAIDFLDALTVDDLIKQGEVHESWIPELLSYAEDTRCILTIAAVALGANPPNDLFADFSFNQVDCEFDDDFAQYIDSCYDNYFGNHETIATLSFSDAYRPYSDYGPYSCNYPFQYDLEESIEGDFDNEREMGILGAVYYFGEDASGSDQNYVLFHYDSSRYTRDEARRIACGIITAHTIDDTLEIPINENRPFWHRYIDEPDYEEPTHFSLQEGFTQPKANDDFTRWQVAIRETVFDAIYDGRVSLCPVCGTPIITKSHQSRVEYCCESHKTIASKRRREQAHLLCASGTPLEEAVSQIGEDYRASIIRWYKEASKFTTPAQ